MEDAAFFGGGQPPSGPLPAGVALPSGVEELTARRWETVAFSAAGCQALAQRPQAVCRCTTALLPGGWCGLAAGQIQAEQVVSCGLSARDSLTFSSLGEGQAVLCIQRALTRPDGDQVEPQELIVSCRDCQPEDRLALLGLGLLL